jgi:hypothetical protein
MKKEKIKVLFKAKTDKSSLELVKMARESKNERLLRLSSSI